MSNDTVLTAETAAHLEENRRDNGQFGESQHSFPDSHLPTSPMDEIEHFLAHVADEQMGPAYVPTEGWAVDFPEWEEDATEALTAFGPYTAVEDGPYEWSLTVTDDEDGQWLVMRRDHAVHMIVSDIEEDDDSPAKIPSHVLAEHTGVDESVFTLISDSSSRAGSQIRSIIEATDSTRNIADAIANRNDYIGPWYSTYDGETRELDGTEFLSFRRE